MLFLLPLSQEDSSARDDKYSLCHVNCRKRTARGRSALLELPQLVLGSFSLHVNSSYVRMLDLDNVRKWGLASALRATFVFSGEFIHPCLKFFTIATTQQGNSTFILSSHHAWNLRISSTEIHLLYLFTIVLKQGMHI